MAVDPLFPHPDAFPAPSNAPARFNLRYPGGMFDQLRLRTLRPHQGIPLAAQAPAPTPAVKVLMCECGAQMASSPGGLVHQCPRCSRQRGLIRSG